jgi:hypothetical protein
LVDDKNESNHISAADSLDGATAEEFGNKSDAHSSEVSTSPDFMALRILDQIRKDMETEMEREKDRIEKRKKRLEEMLKEENPEDNEERRKEIKRMKEEIEKEPEDDKHRKSRHITNWFVQKVDRFQEFKMLGCKECIVSFDPEAIIAVPKKIDALKYVSFETTAHMTCNFNQCEALLFEHLVMQDKFSLTCWPFELASGFALSPAQARRSRKLAHSPPPAARLSEKPPPMRSMAPSAIARPRPRPRPLPGGPDPARSPRRRSGRCPASCWARTRQAGR